jgi:hypothetical protein
VSSFATSRDQPLRTRCVRSCAVAAAARGVPLRRSRPTSCRCAASYPTPDSVPAQALCKALTKTMAFEHEMRDKFKAEEQKALEMRSMGSEMEQLKWLKSLGNRGVLTESGGEKESAPAAGAGAGAGAGSGDGTAAPALPITGADTRIEGIISEAFVRYMGAYVAWERSEFDAVFKKAAELDATDAEVLPSSRAFFIQVRAGGL